MDNTGAKYLTQDIKSLLLNEGFDDVSFARARRLDTYVPAFQNWLESGYQAGMEFMHNYQEKRVDPSLLVPGAKSVVLAIMNYFPKEKQPSCKLAFTIVRT